MLMLSTAAAAGPKPYAKLDAELNQRAASAPAIATTSVILRVTGSLPAEFKKYARPDSLDIADTYVLDVPNSLLKTIATHANILYASHNGTVSAFNFRTGIQSGAFFVRNMLGINGAGIGVALLDSGVAPNSETPVTFFKDFLVPDAAHRYLDKQCAQPCDPNGHGTHVAGTIAGNGVNSGGEKSGMAPGASLIALRVLGADGTGSIDGVLKALEWIRKHAKEQNIRVVNLSFGAKPTSRRIDDPNPTATLLQDPLARATKSLVDAGIFVVAAAGNVGQVKCSTLLPKIATPDAATGKCDVFGGITAPGNFPWVFTVGANSSNGSLTRGDDSRATFSSRGPALPLQIAKPDMLAGGVGIESTSAPRSTLYEDARLYHPEFLLAGSVESESSPYMVLTGTSQAAAVVSGVAAQMLQANPKLTPNLIKAILEYTSQEYYPGTKGYSPLEQGAGFLNALGAVRLSRFYATAKKGQSVPVEPIWSKHIIWGNHEMSGGFMLPKANAWNVGTDWGAATTADGDNIVWGTSCGSSDCGDTIVWGTAADGDNIVWGTADGDNIVWGTAADGDNIVWGTDCSLSGADCFNRVWGTAGAGDNIVWGTAAAGDNIVWGTSSDGDNIVWGTAVDGDNIVWGTASASDNIVWGTFAGDNIVWGTDINTGQPIITPLPSTQFGWYTLFLDRQFDALWVSYEFGDALVSLDGHRKLKPTRSRAHK